MRSFNQRRVPALTGLNLSCSAISLTTLSVPLPSFTKPCYTSAIRPVGGVNQMLSSYPSLANSHIMYPKHTGQFPWPTTSSNASNACVSGMLIGRLPRPLFTYNNMVSALNGLLKLPHRLWSSKLINVAVTVTVTIEQFV